MYFNQLLGAVRTQKLVELLFSALFNLFFCKVRETCTQLEYVSESRQSRDLPVDSEKLVPST